MKTTSIEAIVVVAVLLMPGCDRQQPMQTTDAGSAASVEAEYVGGVVCTGCHRDQTSLWLGSHHDLAMQPADVAHVLGDFNNEEFVYAGVTSTFHESDGTYFVRTDGPDGELHDYAIGYTFGADPLQQYLIEFPDGRLQALSIAWNTRPAEEGGQRWFHLHPNEEIVAGDELHWTAAGYNWNFRCAECHSTNLRKGYDAETDTYRTTWTDINVGCEACHGPGSNHVAWAEEPEETSVTRKGLVVRLDGAGIWERDPTSGNAWLPVPQRGADETELCGRCHARRSQFSENYVHGEPLLDTHRVQLLDPGMYHADGQILDEVYVYGSFRQSRMYAAGVTCSDCHDPHSLKLRAEGDGVCLQCHSAERFATPEHHHHEAGTDASLCVSCHMPERTYMVVDPRRDHSFRIPRPDLSVEYATPNACNDCHEDEDAVWAAAAIENWYGPERKGFQDYTHALFAVRNALPESRGLLVEVATDTSASAIARATAIQELGNQLDRATFGIVASGLQAEDPIVRRAAVSALEFVEPSMRVVPLVPLLEDPVRGVRIEAARLLASIPPGDLEQPMFDTIDRAMNEYIEAERFNTDHPSGWLNLGNFYTAREDYDEAGTAFDNALKLEPSFVPAYVNRAEMERRRGNEGAVEEILLAGLESSPHSPGLNHSLALLRIRQQRNDEALPLLKRAWELSPDTARFGYVYAIALNSEGNATGALKVLEELHERAPNDPEVLHALVTFNVPLGRLEDAYRYAQLLLELDPENERVRQLVEGLSAED